MIGVMLPKGIFRYTFMPQIMPRVRELFMGGFGHIPYFLAYVYQMVGLLPQNHTYLDYSNIGRFGIRHVVAQAASHIQFSFRNIDQIFLFVVILVGLVIFMVQFFAMAAIMFMQPAMALPTSWADLFTISDANFRNHDLASMMLDMVFGVPFPGGTSSNGSVAFFESCIASAEICRDNFGFPLVSINLAATTLAPALGATFSPLAPGAQAFFPFPYHSAMHQLFAIYSNGLLIIAMIITSYFVVTILAETAQSGIPFGRRFNKTWAPLRIVIAFGLLVPLTVGLNSSQYVVLYAAKYGSAFASNGWRYFNETLTGRYLDDAESLVSVPNIPDLSNLVQFMYVAQTCKYVYEYLDLLKLQQEALRAEPPQPVPTSLPAEREVVAYALTAHSDNFNASPIGFASPYQQVVNGVFVDVEASYYTIRFGVQDAERFPSERAHVSPICGEIQMGLTDSRPLIPFNVGPPLGFVTADPGPGQVQEGYFGLVRDMWHARSLYWTGLAGTGASSVPHALFFNHRFREVANRVVVGLPENPDATGVDINHAIRLDAVFAQAAIDRARTRMSDIVRDAAAAQAADIRLNEPSDANTAVGTPLYEKGWAAAGIWYNRIAEMNGTVTASVYAAPIITAYPSPMEKVAKIKAKYDKSVVPGDRFKLQIAGSDDLTPFIGQGFDTTLAKALEVAFDEWKLSAGDPRSTQPTGNPFLSAIASVLGLDGLYNMRENPNTHPLAMLSGVGRSLVESSIAALGYAAISVGIGLVFQDLPEQLTAVPAKFFVTVAMIGLTVGFVLFYVVPFLPFLYFFFAVGGWIKGIFEALVGAPLWALAHIRIDGNGLPGNAALNGYFLIFEVFLRPILIVFGLLASISTYSALVSVLNNVFSLVVENTAGYDIQSELVNPRFTINYMRGLVDEFFFTVIYAIVVYMLGMSSFKLIDTIPNNILRWMGQSVATFNDQREDVAAQLVSKSSVGSQQVISRIGGGLSAAVGAATAKSK